MKSFLSFVVFLCVFMGCKTSEYRIEGDLGTTKYDGEKIFLVPFEKHTPDDVDSTLIEDGRFYFEGDEEYIAILRTRPQLRLRLEELLVVTEPGTTSVKIGEISTANGTPQNNALDKWKEMRIQTIQKSRDLMSKIKVSTGQDSMIYRLELDSLVSNNHDQIFEIIKEIGLKSTVGSFLFEMEKSNLKETQKSELGVVSN